MHGGYGYLKAYPVQQFMRDCRVHQILEGKLNLGVQYLLNIQSNKLLQYISRPLLLARSLHRACEETLK